MRSVTQTYVRTELRRACLRSGSQKAWAAAHGVSPAYVHDALQGRREPGAKILAALGYERRVRYVRRSNG
jgi:DNA-binding transcriptional regulator YdaS (Cro superfamily)